MGWVVLKMSYRYPSQQSSNAHFRPVFQFHFYCYEKTQTTNNLREKGPSPLLRRSEGRHLKQVTLYPQKETEAYLLACQHACLFSVSFLLSPPDQGMILPTMGWVFWYQLTIKTMLRDMATGQLDLEHSLLRLSSEVTFSCVKLTVNCHCSSDK